MTDLVLTESTIGDLAVITVQNDLDLYGAPKLRESLLAKRGHRSILLDLTACTFLDATGLAVIVGGLKRARELLGGDLRIACDEEPILRVFRTTGLVGVITIYPTGAEAVAAHERGEW